MLNPTFASNNNSFVQQLITKLIMIVILVGYIYLALESLLKLIEFPVVTDGVLNASMFLIALVSIFGFQMENLKAKLLFGWIIPLIVFMPIFIVFNDNLMVQLFSQYVVWGWILMLYQFDEKIKIKSTEMIEFFINQI